MSDQVVRYPPLQVGAGHRLGVGWWGVLAVILTEGALFGYLLFSYAYCALQLDVSWMPEMPSLRLSLPNTGILILSSVAIWWGERNLHAGRRGRMIAGTAIALALGVVFVGIQLLEWHSRPFSFRSHLYGSLFFTITGFHMAHVVAGLLGLLALLVWSLLGYVGRERDAALSTVSAYWHFVDAVWLAVFTTLYLSPYALGS